MTFPMTYRKITLLLAVLSLTLSMGCSQSTANEDESEATDDTSSEIKPIETVSLGEADFTEIPVETITSLDIAQNVGAVDFGYLSTLDSIKYITVDSDNKYLKSSFSENSDGCMLWSGDANSILYIPGVDNLIELGSGELAQSFRENTTLKLYVKGAVLEVKYNRGGDDNFWFISRIEYGKKYINFAKPLQFGANRRLRVYDTEEALVFALGYSAWDHAIIFTDEEMYELNPEFGDFGADDTFLDKDGCRFYIGDDGQLRFEKIVPQMIDTDNEEWYDGFLASREQIWKREGRVDYHLGRPYLSTERIYTVADWFAAKDTSIDDWFAGLGSQYETLDEYLASNKTVEVVDYSTHGVASSKYKRSKTGIINGVYTGYLMSYSFKNSIYPTEKYYFVMKLPQLSSTKPGAVALNTKIANKYFYQNSDYIKHLEKSQKDCPVRLNLSYQAFKAGTVTVISIHVDSALIGTGGMVDIYDVYYYDTATDKELTHDEFIRKYTDNTLTYTDLLGMVNELDVIKSGFDEYQSVVTEDDFFGVIPDKNGKFFTLFRGFRMEGSGHAAGYFDGSVMNDVEYTQKNR